MNLPVWLKERDTTFTGLTHEQKVRGLNRDEEESVSSEQARMDALFRATQAQPVQRTNSFGTKIPVWIKERDTTFTGLTKEQKVRGLTRRATLKEGDKNPLMQS